jgi:hypothetical protein
MKRIVTLAAAILMTVSVWAQAPEKMSYQAVVRDASNALVTNQAVGMQISILQTTTTGTAVYVETQNPTTNANGLVSLEIGSGTVVSGDFSTIDWADGPYFIKTETDPTGGTTYTIAGTSQLMSVPYALHSKTAESITGTVTYTETDPIFGASLASSIAVTDTTYWNNKLTTEVDGSVTNEIQALSMSNDTLYLSNGGFVKLPAGFDGQYTSLTGAPTNVSTFTNDAAYLTSFTEIDSSVTNEIQTINRNGTTVTLSNGGGTFTDSVNTYTSGTNITISPSNVISASGGSTDKFYLGQDTLGGIVYYIYKDATGTQHGLIVNTTESIAAWQATGTFTNANRSWDGAYNTPLMTSSAAATYVTLLGAGWYLPSIDELSLLWQSRFTTNKALNAGTFILLSSKAIYWSSTEFSTADAFYFYFNFGSVSNSNKSNTLSVRAVRAF